jgi:hypothetical protein
MLIILHVFASLPLLDSFFQKYTGKLIEATLQHSRRMIEIDMHFKYPLLL